MSVRLHRVKKIEYAGEFTKTHSPVIEWIESNCDVNDQRNMDNGGMLEIRLGDMKKALQAINSGELEAEPFEKKALIDEIEDVEKAGFTDEDYIQYDCF
jgi:hypothetical protein